MSIICYHAVDPDWDSPISVEPAAFARHCAWLSRRRRVVGLDGAVAAMGRTGRLPRGLAAITFDDGFASVLEHGLPALLRHRLPATVFLVAETLTATGRVVDWVEDPPDGPLLTLRVDQVREMRQAGVTFGSHSFSHRVLPDLSDDECERDLRSSREVLEEVVGERVRWLAYPRGLHDEGVRRAAERAGFTHAFSLPEAPQPAGRYAIPRVGMYRGNGPAALRAKTSRWYLPLRTSRAFPALRTMVRGRRPPTRRTD